MNPSSRSPSVRSAASRAFAFALLACLALAACKRADPMDSIRADMAAGRYEEAVEPLRELLKQRPDDAELNFLLGQALTATQPSLAIWSLRKAMEDPAWLVPAGTQLAYLALAGFDFNEAFKILDRLLEVDPENTRLLMMRAKAYAHSKRNPELAIADANRILEIDATQLQAYEPMILGLLNQNKLEEATAKLAEVGKKIEERGMSESILAWHCATMGVFQEESKQLDVARKTWLRCVEAHPVDQDVVTNAMKFFDAQGDSERALEILRAAQAGAPQVRPFRIALAQRMAAAGDVAGAEALLREPTKDKDPNVAIGAWLDVAKFQQAAGRYDEAADSFGQAVRVLDEVDAENPQVEFEYADALLLAGQLERAEDVAEDLSLPAHRHLMLGRVAHERRDPERALEEYGEALRLWPDNPWARYYAALAAEELGDFDRALEELRDSIRIDPGATDARTRGARQLLAKGNPAAALVVLQTAMGEKPLDIEGLLLGIHLSGITGNATGVSDFLKAIEARYPGRAGDALEAAADGLTVDGAPMLAVSMLVGAPNVDFSQLRYAAALRALVRYSHAAGQSPELRKAFDKIFAARTEYGLFEDVRALDLELSGAPKDAVVAAYTRAVELAPNNAHALASLGRLALPDDPKAALGWFDRAAAADPSQPQYALDAARALVASGDVEQAKQRLDALLLEHPYVGAAAAERARLDLQQGVATPQTLERARRAVRFGGGVEALELLSQVLAQRDEPELAARAAEEARSLRQAKPPQS